MAIILALIIVLGLLSFWFIEKAAYLTYQGPVYVEKPIPKAPDYSGFFASTTLSLGAKAAYVIDLSTGRTLFSKDATIPLPLASLTKLMTAVTALKNAGTSTTITISASAIATEGDSGLYSGERWRLDSLLRFSLVVSSNDGAAAVAQNIGNVLLGTSTKPTFAQATRAFVTDMNAEAETIGLAQAVFYDPTGLDLTATSAGAYASAKDVATLLTYAAVNYPDIVDATRYPTVTATSESGITHRGKNTDILPLEGLSLIAGKTGTTDLAGGNLAVITTIGTHPVVIIDLGSSDDGRFADVAALASSSARAVAVGG